MQQHLAALRYLGSLDLVKDELYPLEASDLGKPFSSHGILDAAKDCCDAL